NYHTFNGEVYQYQYINGLVAGTKIRNLIDSHVLQPEQAVVGFVSNYPNPDAISAFTAFYLGVRAVAPEAVMRVRYTYAWSSYTREKAEARKMISEGCILIAQQSHTYGPAAACEEAAKNQIVFHVGNHRSMLDVAPTTSLVSGRVNWTPYIVGAVEAVMHGRPIEKTVEGIAHGNDMSAGFSHGWVEMLELNAHIVPYGMEDRVRQAVEDFEKGKITVFRGKYTGTNPKNPSDTIDLTSGFTENRDSSFPSFHYILDDLITVEN
ncbi:MAG: BMP family ABC transporter substrate-binding protein, partial [Clostridia bacterium]|nr:BMP family ABC transporter substrate-binding protein [Clostridia bacterium]